MLPQERRVHAGFRIEPLTDTVAVGAVSARAAFLWLRSERAGALEIRYAAEPSGPGATFEVDERASRADRTFRVALPAPGAPALMPGTCYRYEVRRIADRTTIGAGRFETAPTSAASAPERFAVALMSCNQPFDDDGAPVQRAVDMLAATDRCLAEHATKLVLTTGDQMYTDYPPTLSLFNEEYFARIAPPGRRHVTDCTAEEVRALLHQRHRLFFALPEWQALHAHYPCYPIWDDHEMIDNWGSAFEHSEAEWRAFAEGGRAAYFDYQASRVLARDEPGEDFDFEIEWGPLAIHVMDLRSNRRMTREQSQVCSPRQEERLVDFLRRHGDTDVLAIVLSVPMAHLPRWASHVGHFVMRGGEDFSDRWSAPPFLEQRDRLLLQLYEHQRAHPEQRILLLSGDIHVACAHAIAWEDGTRPLLQLVSSGITNHVSQATQLAARLSILAKQQVRVCVGDRRLTARVRLIRGEPPHAANPYTELNLGLLELERAANGRYRPRFLVYGHDGPSPVCVYRSPWL